jgi:hypothetical protein
MKNYLGGGQIGTTTGTLYAGDETMTLSGDEVSSRNGVEILAGVLGMGLKLGFKENLRVQGKPIAREAVSENTIKLPDNSPMMPGQIVDAKTTMSFEDDPSVKGEILPSAAFGMLFPLGRALIKPFVKLELIFNLNSASLATSTDTRIAIPSIGITNMPAASEKESRGHGENYIFPVIAGGIMVDFVQGSPVMQGFKLEYITGSKRFSNDYDVMGQSGTVDGFVSWNAMEEQTVAPSTNPQSPMPIITTTKTVTITENELSHIQHQIVPTYWYMNNLTDNAIIGFNLGLPVIYSLGKSSVSETTTKTTTTAILFGQSSTTTDPPIQKDLGSTEVMVLNIHPVVYVGGTYKALPSKLHLYGGLGVDMPSFTYSRTNKTGVERQEIMPDPADPSKPMMDTSNPQNPVPVYITVKGDTETTAVLWLPTVVHAGAGATFYFNDIASLGAGVKVSSNGDKEVNILFALQR